MLKKTGKAYIYGSTSDSERMLIFKAFQHDPKIKTIFVSKVGDTSIDLPDATVIIQISSHFGSRRQEAQRLGRILRPKPRAHEEEGHNAYFYTLVSTDTSEMYFSTKRQQFLVDQGYSFKVIKMESLPDLDPTKLHYGTKEEQTKLLQDVLSYQGDKEAKEEKKLRDKDDIAFKNTAARRVTGNINSLSGATNRAYMEVDASARIGPSISDIRSVKHPIFRQRANEVKKAAKEARLAIYNKK